MAKSRNSVRFKIFISYARDDGMWRDHVRRFLSCLPKNARIEVWSDQNLRAGTDWLAGIEREIEAASVAVLLVTDYFLASEFIQRKEVPKILRRERKNGLVIYPLLIRECPYQSVAWLRSLQWRPSGKRYLQEMRPAERARELTAFAYDIEKIVRDQITAWT